MIPVQLELTNFLSYRKTTVIDFNGIHLACISGANGAGKSTLLDGMIWSLFGKSRAPTVDDVVNRLAAMKGEEAEVRLTFMLGSTTYRVIRRRNPGRSTSLELQIANVAGEWQSLSEGGVRETDAAICDLLGMTYETFVNSSFLLQGKADEFTTKTPGERKQILADLLGVTVWDSYQARARERRRRVAEGQTLLDARMGDIAQELADRPVREAVLAEAREKLHSVEEQLKAKEQLLDQARRTEAAVQQQRDQLQNLAATVDRSERRLARLEEEQRQKQKALDAHQQLLAEAEPIRADYAAWQDVEQQWERWQEMAGRHAELRQRRHAHELTVEGARNRLQQEQKALEAEAGRVATLLEGRGATEEEQAAAAVRLAGVAAEKTDLAAQIAAYNEARAALERVESRRTGREEERRRLRQEAQRVDRLRQEVQQETRRQATAAAEVADLVVRQAATLAQREALSAARAMLAQLQEEQPRLKEEMDELKERIDRLRGDLGGVCPLCGQELTAEHRATVLADLEHQGRQRGDRWRANREGLQAQQNSVARLEPELRQSEQVEERLRAEQDNQARAEARIAELARAIAAWEAEGQPALEQITNALADTAELDAARRQVEALAGSAERQLALDREQQEQQQAMARTAARLQQIDEAAAAWESTGSAQLAEVTSRLAGDAYALEARAALAALDQEIAALGYDPEAHDQVRRRRATLQQARQRHEALQQAETAADLLQESLSSLAVQVAEEGTALAGFVAQRDNAQEALAALTADELDLHVVEQETFDLRQQRIDVASEVRVEENRVQVLDDQERYLAALQEERQGVRKQMNQLRQLEEACGRDGVQALLIEQALPDIEVRANELLQRLTGGAMQVIFETQRKLKSRDELAETLDIRISDRTGERPYENYSGGEQFRVNFAIRLALSQLLAHRAGRQLQTLVIDEGFGSQDPAGRQRLVEAINTIQDDFKLILVITHIDELKEAFPARIEVEKGDDGSQVSIVL